MIIILFCSNDLYHVVIDIIISTIIFVIILPIITSKTITNMSMVITAIPVIIIVIIRPYQSARYSMMATDCVSTRPSISRQGTFIIIKVIFIICKVILTTDNLHNIIYTM